MAGNGRNGQRRGAARPRPQRNGGNGNRNGRRRRPVYRQQAATRSRGDIVLAQGAAAIPRNAFGSFNASSLACWDAKLPHHLSLPRSVGPYLVVRTTKRFPITSEVTVIGTFKAPYASNWEQLPTHGGHWSDVCAVQSVNALDPIGQGGNAVFKDFDMDGFGKAATIVPSALTVQLVSPNAMGKSVGVCYAGVMTTQAAVGGDTRPWRTYAEQFVEFMNPRMLMAGKMSLRGVQVSSYPLNMGAVSEFTPLYEPTGLDKLGVDQPQPVGWAPIMVYMPPPDATAADEAPMQLEALVTTEWRVRFDLTNPASAGHRHHPLSSDWTWEALMRKAVALGNGVLDIADVVANTGQAAHRAIGAARPLLALGA